MGAATVKTSGLKTGFPWSKSGATVTCLECIGKMTRKMNENGRLIVREAEGLRLQAYRNKGDVWTIGYGHTLGVKEGDTCTEAQAEAWLSDDIAEAERDVEKLVTVPLTDNQFSALADFAFEEGREHLATSTLLKKLNAGHYELVPDCLKSWVFCAGKVQGGQVKRRAAEIALWNTP